MNIFKIYSYRFIKRVIDVEVSSFGLMLSAPLILFAAILVKLDSPGPVFYRSRRLGRHFRPFDLLKLRTMVVKQVADAPQVTCAKDTRITRVGRWLRLTKIDELPQLFNVLVGDVSLIGPRPEVEKYIKCYPQQYQKILSIRPGLSDETTIKFIDEESILAVAENPERMYIEEIMPQKIQLYLNYVDNPSIRNDLIFVGKTLFHLGERVKKSVSHLAG